MFNKTIAVALLLTFITFSLYAQKANFKGGLEIGIMGTQVDGDTLSGYDKAGLRLGAFIEREINKDFDIQFALLYTQKGAKGAKKPNDLSSYYETNLHYIDMPLTGRYKHHSGLMGEAGLALGYLFKQQEMGYDDFTNFRKDNDPGFNRFEVSWHLGLGYRIFANVIVHTQFNYSLLRIRGKYDSQIPGVFSGQFNNTLMVSLQIFLGKSRKA